jgi:imidazolonepropionase-like amidohydrolase
MVQALVFKNALVIDGSTDEPREGTSVVVADGLIQEVDHTVTVPTGAKVIDCAGASLLPGLIDAHVHVGAVDVDFGNQARLRPASLISLLMAKRLRHMLDLGYTTVRDAGGADWGFRSAVAEGLIPGPDLLISAAILSQTGGHGDMRQRAEHDCCQSAVGMVFAIADGVPAVRQAVREQVRQGADFIKVMASGGAASPTDKLHCAQYSLEELQVIVEEAARADVYVAAHALPAVAIEQAVNAGVRTVEHGNFLTLEIARRMVASKTALIPTVATYVMAARHPEKYSDPPEVVAKISMAAEGAMRAVEAAYEAGVEVGSGSDLLGDEISWLPHEHELRADIVGAARAIRAATSDNASILGLTDRGRIQPGLRADLLVLRGNPLDSISLLATTENVLAVTKNGRLHRLEEQAP